MNNGRFLDRALLLAILATLGGLYWQTFSMNERLARVETRLEYASLGPTERPVQQSSGE